MKATIDRFRSPDLVALLFECPSLSPTIYRASPGPFQRPAGDSQELAKVSRLGADVDPAEQ